MKKSFTYLDYIIVCTFDFISGGWLQLFCEFARLNDRVKNQIRLMLSSTSSSDTSSVVSVFEKSGKNPDSYKKTSNKLEVKKVNNLEASESKTVSEDTQPGNEL